MDKRELITIKSYYDTHGNEVRVPIYKKSHGRGVTVRVTYGTLQVYAGYLSTISMVDKCVKRAIEKSPDRILNRPFHMENCYIYHLGKKKYFTNDVSKENDEFYFYIPRTTKDPITRYKKMFLEYLNARVVYLGKLMNRDLTSWKIRTGLFISYYGVCFPTKHQFKFDYRLFAYEPYLIDAIIIHEIAHTYEIHHNQRFYSIVQSYCPDYYERIRFIENGYFEGERDQYVIQSH